MSSKVVTPRRYEPQDEQSPYKVSEGTASMRAVKLPSGIYTEQTEILSYADSRLTRHDMRNKKKKFTTSMVILENDYSQNTNVRVTVGTSLNANTSYERE